MLLQILLNHFCKVLQSANQLCSVGHFIVIPSYSFNQLLVANSQNFSLSCIKQGTESDSLDIGRYDFVFCVSESFWIGSFLHSCVNFFSRYFFVQNSYELSQGTSSYWYTLSCTIKDALQFWDYQTDCFSSTSCVRDDVFSCCASTTEVTFRCGASNVFWSPV